MARIARLGVVVLALAAGACGVQMDLPTELAKGQGVVSQSYQMIATWTGMDGIRDILLTPGAGSQLFLLFQHDGSDTTPRGTVLSYPRTRPEPLPGFEFANLFNPHALCAGGNRIFVLDQGDTCLARANPANGTCSSTGGWNQRITRLHLYWRVREYSLLGGDTISTFTDTSMTWVNGIAADAEGNVYVAGTAIIRVPDPTFPSIRTRTTQYRIHKYRRGPRYPGVQPPDRNMPGANWHRDTTFIVEEGSGIGTVVDPRGMQWNASLGGDLYVADYGKTWVQRVIDDALSQGVFFIDGSGSGTPFTGPEDVAVDVPGYIYAADIGTRRVLRFGPTGEYVQNVNIENDAQGQPLGSPVAVAADDSLVYVADRALGKVVRYKRRS